MNEKQFPGLSSYLENVQRIGKEGQESKSSQETLLSFLEFCLSCSQGISSYENFFKGERHFFKREDDFALQYYRRAYLVPNIDFFYYRSSAYLAREEGSWSKALQWARRAQNIYPEEHWNFKLLQELTAKATEQRSRQGEELDGARNFSLAGEEIDALNRLFS